MSFPRITVSIAAHFTPQRAQFLAQALRAIAAWRFVDVSLTIDTNDLAIQSAPEVREACQQLASDSVQFQFALANQLEHPHHLTWVHKKRLLDWSNENGNDEEYFIYIEDDVVVSSKNLKYLLQTYPKAAVLGCTPGLIRWEGDSNGRRFATDFLEPQLVENAATLKIDDIHFVEPKFPYWAGFIVDRKLARDYLASSWSERDSTEAITRLGTSDCRAQSAFGPTFVAVPQGMLSRMIVPVDIRLCPLPECIVHHCAENYVSERSNDFASIPLENIFSTANGVTTSQLALFRLGALARRARRWFARTFF